MFKNNPKLKNVFFLGFLLSLHLAFTSYINSSFLANFFGERSISFIYILASIVSTFTLFFVPKMLKRFGEYKFMLWTSGLNAISLLFLSLLNSKYGVVPVFIFYFTVNSLIVFALDELLQIFSKSTTTGRVRGLYLAIINTAWIVAQAISGEVLSSMKLSFIYFVAFCIMSLFFIVSLYSLKKIHDPKYDKTIIIESFKKFFANKNLARAYKINFLLQFFYVWMIIYTPIYLHSYLGFDWKDTSIIFTIMLLPFVLIQFPLGNYSDKIGERKMLMLGFLVASLSTISLFFIKGHDLWMWAAVLFATRIGAAIIEVMSDVYFFKHISSENDEFIAVYRNTAPMAYIFAPLVAFLVFSFTPQFNFIFLILGAILLYGVYLSSTIRRNDI